MERGYVGAGRYPGETFDPLPDFAAPLDTIGAVTDNARNAVTRAAVLTHAGFV
jgi:hypothetical protein